MKIFTFDPGKDKPVYVGDLIGDTLYRRVLPEHYYHNSHSWALQKDVFKKIDRCIYICIREQKSGKEHWTTVTNWLEKGIERDEGNGTQIFLHEAFFVSEEEIKHQTRQGTLF